MTSYRLYNENESITFKSTKEASEYLGVSSGQISNAWFNRCRCRGYYVERISDSFHGETGTRLYRIWRHMHERCESDKHIRYDKYGGRGISVCKEWGEYKPFAEWARENGYADGLSIDRINNDDGYYPGNCRWATIKEQNNNKSNCVHLSLNGETHTVAEWADITGMKHSTILERMKRGWDDEEVLTRPLRPHVRKK